VISRFQLPGRIPPSFPWARPRHELVLVALVALVALTPLYPISAQDVARMCLARSAIHHMRLYSDDCLGTTFAIDRAEFNGHYYSDKAPGMSALEVPAVELTALPNVTEWPYVSRPLWVVRILSGGIAFVIGLLLVGRISEGLAPGFGGPALVSFGLGTLVAPIAATSFEHVTAGTLGLGAFALAWSRRTLISGLIAGAALLVAYEAALILVILAVYVALQGRRALVDFVLGAVPGVALLFAYNWLAFGAPWHFSYRYVASDFAARQARGFFGIGLPSPHALQVVLIGRGGLLVISPIVIAAVYGLVILSRSCRAEAVVCAFTSAAFLIVDAGYFDPIGGTSPGPRFLVPGLAFLAVGLGPAFARRFTLTATLTVISVVAMTALTLTWPNGSPGAWTIWGEIVRAPVKLGSSPLAHRLVDNIIGFFGPSPSFGAAVVVVAAAAAVALALGPTVVARVGDRAPAA
jgi:hypothetical protein